MEFANLGSQRLAVVVPTYWWMPSTFFGHVVSMDKFDVVHWDVTVGVYVVEAMQTMVTNALKVKGWDRLVVMEQDNLPPKNALRRASMHTQDIVGGMYFRHTFPHEAVVYMPEGNDLYPIMPETVKAWVEKPGLYECGAVGLGFTTIARKVLENWDSSIPWFKYGHDHAGQSHDNYFCRRAREQGFRIYVDTQLVLPHLTQTPVDYNHNQAAAPYVQGPRKVLTLP